MAIKSEHHENDCIISETFKRQVASYLSTRAESESQFASKLCNPNKSIEECCRYIVSEMFKTALEAHDKEPGQQNIGYGVDDADVYGLAVHYYDEEDVKVGDISVPFLVAGQSQDSLFTEEEKASIRKEAHDAAVKDIQASYATSIKLHSQSTTSKPKGEKTEQLSLF